MEIGLRIEIRISGAMDRSKERDRDKDGDRRDRVCSREMGMEGGDRDRNCDLFVSLTEWGKPQGQSACLL